MGYFTVTGNMDDQYPLHQAHRFAITPAGRCGHLRMTRATALDPSAAL